MCIKRPFLRTNFVCIMRIRLTLSYQNILTFYHVLLFQTHTCIEHIIVIFIFIVLKSIRYICYSKSYNINLKLMENEWSIIIFSQLSLRNLVFPFAIWRWRHIKGQLLSVNFELQSTLVIWKSSRLEIKLRYQFVELSVAGIHLCWRIFGLYKHCRGKGKLTQQKSR